MAESFAPFGGITRIRFKGSVTALFFKNLDTLSQTAPPQ